MAHWLDRLTGAVAPRWTLHRTRARIAGEFLQRHYEAAAAGRRTQGWARSSSDPNAAALGGLAKIRDQARDLIRNNPYAASAVDTIVDHAVGWGITAYPAQPGSRRSSLEAWSAWADTTACDADGRHDFSGLQKLVMRTVVESGEVLVRRRIRRPEDELPLPIQLQVLEPDFLDTSKDGLVRTTPDGTVVARTIQGIEFDALGRRSRYWLFREHPGANIFGGRSGQSDPIPASEILHVFRGARPGQVRGVSWFAPVVLKMRDFDEYEDAALMKQKIAACLAILTTDPDGTAPALGETTADQPGVDTLEPGTIANLPPGRSVTVVDPPTVREHKEYAETVLRAIAAGLGLTYEDLTGDYTDLPFSAARMSRIRHWARVEDWRWRTLIPQLCDPVWAWAAEAAIIAGLRRFPVTARWTPPPMPMIEPDKEGLAYQRNIRTGIITLSEAIRERGYDPDELLQEMADDWERLDRLGLILDCDPRMTTQAGTPRTTETATTPPAESATARVRRIDSARMIQARQAVRAFEAIERVAGQAIAVAGQRTASGDVHVETKIEKGAFRNEIAPPAIQVAPGAFQATIQAPPAPSVHIEAPVSVSPPAVTIAEGAVKTTVPITVADTVHVPAGRTAIERDEHGRIAALISETHSRAGRAIATRAMDGRLRFVDEDAERPSDGPPAQ